MDSKIINAITPGDLHKINNNIESIEVSLRSEYSNQELLDLTHMIREQLFKEIESLDSSNMEINIDQIIYQNQYINHELFKDAGKNEVLYTFTFQRGLNSVAKALKAPFSGGNRTDGSHVSIHEGIDLQRERSKIKTFIWPVMLIYIFIATIDIDEGTVFSFFTLILVVFFNVFFVNKVTKEWMITNFIFLQVVVIMNAIIGSFGFSNFLPELLMMLGFVVYPLLLISILFRLAKENYMFGNFNHKPFINQFIYFVVLSYCFTLGLLILTAISQFIISQQDENLIGIILVLIVFNFLVYISGGFDVSPKPVPEIVEQPHGSLTVEEPEIQETQQTPSDIVQSDQSSKVTKRIGIIEFTPDLKKLRQLTKFGRFRWTKRVLFTFLIAEVALFVINEITGEFYDNPYFYELIVPFLIANIAFITWIVILDVIDWYRKKKIRVVIKHLLLRQGVMDHDYFYEPPADMTSDEYTQIIGQLILDKHVQVKFLREGITK